MYLHEKFRMCKQQPCTHYYWDRLLLVVMQYLLYVLYIAVSINLEKIYITYIYCTYKPRHPNNFNSPTVFFISLFHFTSLHLSFICSFMSRKGYLYDSALIFERAITAAIKLLQLTKLFAAILSHFYSSLDSPLLQSCMTT